MGHPGRWTKSVLVWHDVLARKQEAHSTGKDYFIPIQSKQPMMLHRLFLKESQTFWVPPSRTPPLPEVLVWIKAFSHLGLGESSGDSSPTNQW